MKLRPVHVRDEAAWGEIRRRATDWFVSWDSTRPSNSVEPRMTFAELVRSYQFKAKSGTMLPWAVTYAPTPAEQGIFVGQVTVSGIAYGSACWGTIGYWIDPVWAGRGIIPLAVAMATDYCFKTLGLHRMEIAIRPENVNSLAVVRKLGFRHEARIPRYMHVAGQWRDHDLFALHSEEVPEGLVNRLQQR